MKMLAQLSLAMKKSKITREGMEDTRENIMSLFKP